MSNVSPTPGTPQTPAKAFTAAIVAAVFLACLLSLYDALEDGGVTAREGVAIAIAGVVGTGLTGGATYQVKNRPTGDVTGYHESATPPARAWRR